MSEETPQTPEMQFWDEAFDPDQQLWDEKTIVKYHRDLGPISDQTAQEFKVKTEAAASKLGETPQKVFFAYLLKAVGKEFPAGRYSEELIQEVERTIQSVVKQASSELQPA